MIQAPEFSSDQGTVTISVPLVIRRHGGRRQVVSPAGAPDLSLWPVFLRTRPCGPSTLDSAGATLPAEIAICCTL